jgi:hypothetical protein
MMAQALQQNQQFRQVQQQQNVPNNEINLPPQNALNNEFDQQNESMYEFINQLHLNLPPPPPPPPLPLPPPDQIEQHQRVEEERKQKEKEREERN